MKKTAAMILMVIMVLSMSVCIPAEPARSQDQMDDVQEYLWEISADMDDEAFETARTRNYKIIKEWEPLFTEDSFHAVYAANVHVNQKKDGAREEFVQALEDLVQVKSVAEGICWLWGEDNMPVYGNREYSEADLDGGKLDGYGFVPYMINYLLEDPSQAKGNILLFSGGSRTNDGEAFPTARVFNELGYNCFVVNNRMAPYTTQDSDLDTQRAIRMVKYLGTENGWGGMDMIALCGFSAGGLKVINCIENAFITETPDQLGAEAYVSDEIDKIPAQFNTAILVYTGNDEMLKETGCWPALFMVAGSEDGTGATQRLENYYENAKDIVPSELIVYEGAGHGFGCGAEGSAFTTEEASHWPEEADRFMQANVGYNQSDAKHDTEKTDGNTAEIPDNCIDLHTEDSAVTVEYYDGAEIIETQEDGLILVQVPEDQKLDHISIFSSGGEITITGVLADTYNLETVHDDMNVYLPEDTAFHVQLTTISDLFESDFMYDVTMNRHEYIFGDPENSVDIEMVTIVGTARVMILQ